MGNSRRERKGRHGWSRTFEKQNNSDGVGEGVWSVPHGEKKGNQREWHLWGPLWEVC